MSSKSSKSAVLERPALDERVIASVKMHYDSQQQEAFLSLESQLNELAHHIQAVSQAA